MQATISLVREGERVTATGRLTADVIQACRVSAEDFPVRIDEPVHLRFVPPAGAITPDEVREYAIGTVLNGGGGWPGGAGSQGSHQA